jgi:uncharacterized membrane protein
VDTFSPAGPRVVAREPATSAARAGFLSVEAAIRQPLNVLAWALAAGFSLGLLVFALWLPEPLAALVLRNQISPNSRTVGTWIVLGAIGLAGLAATLLTRGRDRNRADLVYWLKPLSVAFVLPPLGTPAVWRAEPLLSLAIAIGAAVFVSWTLTPRRDVVADPAGENSADPGQTKLQVAILLGVLIASYAVFVGLATVRQHELLETRAYDLGIMENVFWHTSEGRFFASSLEGRNHLGVHTSFIYLLLAPVFLLIPRPETLLVAQALLIALAAWPLFLLARKLLRSDWAGLLVAALYLFQPAIQGASFYDFHELAFAPLLFFTALYALLSDRRGLLWTSTALLLLVKEDCAFVVAALGVVALLEGRRRIAVLLTGAAAAALVLFHGVVIPRFAGADASFSWYYTEMIPHGEGPVGLVRTVLLNPLFSVRQALTAPKLLYVLETTGPVLFLCFLGFRGAVLVAYGLAISMFASREYLYELGFQYPLQLVPEAFAGSLLILGCDTEKARRLGITPRRALVAMSLISAFLGYHAGMLSPVSSFRSGFRTVSMKFGARDRDRYREVEEASRLIPQSASVTASETLVPHVARRALVQTLRYASDSFGRDYDYFFILKTDLDPGTRERYRYVLNSPEYQLAQEGEYTLLYRRTGAGG